MDTKPIRNKRDCEAALGEIERLMSDRRNTPEGDQLVILATLASEAYEAKHLPLDPPDPVRATKLISRSIAV